MKVVKELERLPESEGAQQKPREKKLAPGPAG